MISIKRKVREIHIYKVNARSFQVYYTNEHIFFLYKNQLIYKNLELLILLFIESFYSTRCEDSCALNQMHKRSRFK